MRGHISTHWLGLLFDYLAQRGCDAAAVTGLKRPQPGELSRMPSQRWRDALEAASQALNDPALGLHLGASVQLRQLGVLGYAISVAPTMAAALNRLQQFDRLVYQIDPVHVRLEGQMAVLDWYTTVDDPGQIVDEAAIAALVACAREVVGPAGQELPVQVSFVNTAPTNTAPYEEYFGCEVLFNAPTTRVSFPARLLPQALATPDPALLAILDQQASLLLDQIPGQDPFESALRRALAEAIAAGDPSLIRISEHMRCAPRTLQRRLDERGLKFQKLLDDSRRQLAEQYLQDTSIPLSEVALLLGYSEQSAFTRSFKRWCGLTPRSWRSRLPSQKSPNHA
ncbi:MAG: AraC family transcriptional regulator [Oceanococcus sp.]|nr:MAG: AraC family transcriptional regulator [Oceanococcus sp.]